MHARALGVDIGGANIKLSDGETYAESIEFAMWKRPGELSAELRRLFLAAPAHELLAVTMTGELADCFENKADGVRHIVAAVEQAKLEDSTSSYYSTDGRWLDAEAACGQVMQVAASNWHALANWVAREEPFAGLLIDIGSTSTDLIPFSDRRVQASGRTDTTRLQAGELVYTGVRRTPLCAVVQQVPYRGKFCPVAAEWFASMEDVYVVLGASSEFPDRTDTCDGRPVTVMHAVQRLGRMLCADLHEFQVSDAQTLATYAAQTQRAQLAHTITQLKQTHPIHSWVIAGEGEFLAHSVLESLGVFGSQSLSEMIGPTASICAPAFALAQLVRR